MSELRAIIGPIHRDVAEIRRLVSPSDAGPIPLAMIAVVELCDGIQDRLKILDEISTESAALPATQPSSVEIESRARGAPAVKVKTYAGPNAEGDTHEAGRIAVAEWERLTSHFDRSEGLRDAAPEMLEVLETLLAESPGDFTYTIRDRVLGDPNWPAEQTTWKHPRVVAWSGACVKADELVRRFGTPKPAEKVEPSDG